MHQSKCQIYEKVQDGRNHKAKAKQNHKASSKHWVRGKLPFQDDGDVSIPNGSATFRDYKSSRRFEVTKSPRRFEITSLRARLLGSVTRVVTNANMRVSS